jgi:hypothetical protein
MRKYPLKTHRTDTKNHFALLYKEFIQFFPVPGRMPCYPLPHQVSWKNVAQLVVKPGFIRFLAAPDAFLTGVGRDNGKMPFIDLPKRGFLDYARAA